MIFEPSASNTSIAASLFSLPIAGFAAAPLPTTSAPPNTFTCTSPRETVELVELPGEFSNREIHVTPSGDQALFGSQIFRAIRQQRVSKRAHSQLRAPERDADARPESRPNDRRFASDVQFPADPDKSHAIRCSVLASPSISASVNVRQRLTLAEISL